MSSIALRNTFTTAYKLIYTEVTANLNFLTELNISNLSSSVTITLWVHIVPLGELAIDANALFGNIVLAPKSHLQWSGRLLLEKNESLQMKTDTGILTLRGTLET